MPILKMDRFKDNFSKQSDAYQKYRPSYPKELFEYLRTLVSNNNLAWDCGTGNGQAAIGLVWQIILKKCMPRIQVKNKFQM